MVRVSRKFFESVKLADLPAYRIAQKAGVDSATLSKLLHGNGKVWPNDRRILKVAKVLKIDPVECFESDSGEPMGKSLLTRPEPEREEI